MRTPAVTHFDRELTTMGVVVTIDATPRFQLEIVSWTLCSVATRARDGLMPAFEGELGSAVLLDGEACGPESVLIVAGPAVRVSKRAAMRVTMTVSTLLEL
jgi:predicted naringenin-chalcone synthase